MADNEGWPIAVVLDDGGDIGCAIVQIDAGHRTAALADPARLRAHRAKPGLGKPGHNQIEIGGAAAERRQQHDRPSPPLDQHLKFNVGAADDVSGQRTQVIHGSSRLALIRS